MAELNKVQESMIGDGKGLATQAELDVGLAKKSDTIYVDGIVATERARIDNISATAGNTTGNTELNDIRVDPYGKTYANAGSAVRAQGGSLRKKQSDYSVPLCDNVSKLTADGSGGYTGGYSAWMTNIQGYFKSYFDISQVSEVASLNKWVPLTGTAANGYLFTKAADISATTDFEVWVRLTSSTLSSASLGLILNVVTNWGNVQSGQKIDYQAVATNKWVKLTVNQTQLDTLKARSDYSATTSLAYLVFSLVNLTGTGYFEFMVLDAKADMRKNSKYYETQAFESSRSKYADTAGVAETATKADSATIADDVKTLAFLPKKVVMVQTAVGYTVAGTTNSATKTEYKIANTSNIIGLTTVFNMLDGVSELYSSVQLAGLYNTWKTSKIRILIKSDDSKDLSFRINFANGKNWGSADNSIGTAYYQDLTLSAANGWQLIVDVDFSDSRFATFYSTRKDTTDMWQQVWYDIVPVAATQRGTFTISTYAYEYKANTSVLATPMDAPYVMSYATEARAIDIDTRLKVIENEAPTMPVKTVLTGNFITPYGTQVANGMTSYYYNGNVIGYKMDVTLNDTNIIYGRARVTADKVYNDLKTKKFRFVIMTDTGDTSLIFRLTNGGAWGSADNTLGNVIPQTTVILNAANNYTVFVDVDLSSQTVADFYAASTRAAALYQQVWYCLEYENSAERGQRVIYTYCYELNQTITAVTPAQSTASNIVGKLATQDQVTAVQQAQTSLQSSMTSQFATVNTTISANASRITSLEGALPALPVKSVLTSVSGTKDPAGTNLFNGATTYAVNGNVIGYKADMTLNDSTYVYGAARITADKVYADLKTKKFRIVFKSDSVTTTFLCRITNGGAWGSADGGYGNVVPYYTVTLNAANGYSAYVDVDLTTQAVADFYALAVRTATPKYQQLWYCVEYENTAERGQRVIYTYAYELNQNLTIARATEMATNTIGSLATSEQLTTQMASATASISTLDGRITAIEGATPNLPVKTALATAPMILANSSGTNVANGLTTYTYNGNIIGYKMDVTLNDASYIYGRARITADKVYADLKTKKFRVVIRTDTGDTSVIFRFTNGGAWGSADGSVGQIFQQTVTLNAANNYTAYVDIDLTTQAVADYYAVAVRQTDTKYQQVWYILDYESAERGQRVLYTYCYELNQAATLMTTTKEMTSNSIGSLATTDQVDSKITSLQAALTTKIDNVSANVGVIDRIVCWGDSLTAQAGWTDRLATLTGLPVYNAGTGGETCVTIMARQGADAMMINNITIPADTSEIQLAAYATGFTTYFGGKATPLLQGGTAHVNPCYIGDIAGTLRFTGTNYADTTGVWMWKRNTAGTAVTIDRPTAIVTNYDKTQNTGLMIIFMGQNGGYSTDADLVNKHKLMIRHSNAKKVVILGLSSGSASSRASYEAAMKAEFGRYFISLREYLSTYGIADSGLTATQADLDAMATGTVPPQLLSDTVHYTATTRTVIGNMLYKKIKELHIL